MAAVAFDTGTPFYCRVAALDSTRFVVAWTRGASSGLGVRVGSVSGGVISFGTTLATIASTKTHAVIALAATDSTHAVLVAQQTSDSPDTLYGYVLTVAGLEVTVGDASANALSIGNSQSLFCMDMCALDSTHVLMACGESDSTPVFYNAVVVGTVSGTDLTWGASAQFNGANKVPTSLAVARLSSTVAVVCYRHGPTNDGDARVLTVSGATVSFGPAYNFETGSQVVASISACALDPARFAVAYYDSQGYMRVGNVSGEAITFGARQSFIGAGLLTYSQLGKLGTDRLALVYGDGTGADTSYFKAAVTAGDAVAFGSPTSFFAGDLDVRYTWAAALSGTDVVVAYRSPTDGDGYADLLSYPAVTIETPTDSVALADAATVRVGKGRADSVPLSDAVDFSGSIAAAFDADAERCRVVKLDSTRFLVAYAENGDGDHLSARVGTLSGEDITFGAVLEVNGAQAHGAVALAALSSTVAVLAAYETTGSPDTLNAYVLTVSGTGVTKGAKATALSVASTSLFNMDLCALDASTVLLVYGEGSGAVGGTAVVGAVSGTDITFGAATEFESAAIATQELGVCTMTSTIAAVAYRRGGITSDTGHARVLTVSGADVTAGAAADFVTSGQIADHVSVVGLDSSRFAVAYKDSLGYMKVGTVAGTDVTFGAQQQFLGTSTLLFSKLAKLGANRLSLVYGDSTGTDTGYFIECAVSGDTVLFGSATPWISGASITSHANTWTAALSWTDVIVAYSGSAGRADLLSYPPVTIEAPVDSVSLADAVAVRVGAARADSVSLADAVGFSGSVAAAFDANAENCRVTALDSTRFLVAYTEIGDDYKLGIRVGTLSGEDITFGALLEIGGGATTWHGVAALAALSSTKAVVVTEQWQTNPDTLDAYVLTVSGTVVTAGAKTTVNTANTSLLNLALCALDASTVLLAYGEGTTTPTFGSAARVGTVSGTDITFGAAAAFNSTARTLETAICKMTSTTAVVCYRDVTANNGFGRVLTVAGTVVSFGAAASFEGSTQIPAAVSVVGLDSARMAVAYHGETSGRGNMRVGTVSGDTVSFGAAQQFLGTATLLFTRLAKLGTDRLSLVYGDDHGAGADTAEFIDCIVSGDTVFFGSPATWLSGTLINANVGTAALDGENVIVAYRNPGPNPQPGKADLLSYPPPTTTTAPPAAALSDSVALADAASLRVGASLPDSVGLSDSLNITFSGALYILDTVSITDSSALGVVAHEADTVSVADSAAFSEVAAAESDALPLADSAAAAFGKVESDDAAVADSTAASPGKAAGDAVALADGAVPVVGKAADDGVALVDSVTFFVGKSVRDAVALPDKRALAWTVDGGPPTTTTAIIAQKEAEHQRVTIWDLFAGSADFAAANVHADIAQRLNLSLPGGGLTVALTKGGYRIDYDAEDDTLHVGCDESDPSGRECHAELGSPTESERGPLLVANLYYCERAALLTGIEQFLGMASPTNVEFFVYEAVDDPVLAENLPHPRPLPEPNTSASYGVIDPDTDDADERHRHARSDFQSMFGLVARFAAGFSAGMRFRSSGPIDVELRQGRFYLVGAAWTSETACFWGGGHPEGTPFGKSLGGLRLAYDGDLPKTLAPTTDASLARPKIDDRAYHQRLTLDGRGIDPGASGASLFVIGPPPAPMGHPGPPGAAGSLRVGTINATGAGIVRILTNVSVGRVIGGPPPQFFGGSIDPPGPEPEKRYAVKVNRVVYRTRQGSPAACRCHRRFYREPEGWREFRTEAEARAYYDTLEPVARAAIGVTEGGLDAVGCRRGPFRPDSVEFRVANSGAFPVAWSASSDSPWVRLSSAGGSLPNPGDEAKVVASLRGAGSLCTGVHEAAVTIANETNGVGTAVRAFRLEVRGKPSPTGS